MISYYTTPLGAFSLVALYRLAQFCLVSSLHDGMNLVAKEFVAARDDEQGVLVLSALAGAAHELEDALIVNPYDADAFAAALERAIEMPRNEQMTRMRAMRKVVSRIFTDASYSSWSTRRMPHVASSRHPSQRRYAVRLKQGTGAIGPSSTRITPASEIFAGSTARKYPPPLPLRL